MTTDSGNSNDITNTDVPLTIERRKPDTDAPVPKEDVSELRPIECTNKVTLYTAQSQIRFPIKLIRDIFADLWAGRDLAWRLFCAKYPRFVSTNFTGTLLGFSSPDREHGVLDIPQICQRI